MSGEERFMTSTRRYQGGYLRLANSPGLFGLLSVTATVRLDRLLEQLQGLGRRLEDNQLLADLLRDPFDALSARGGTARLFLVVDNGPQDHVIEAVVELMPRGGPNQAIIAGRLADHTQREVDSTTGLRTVPDLALEADRWLRRHRGNGSAPVVGCVIADCNHFDAINNTYGHPIGDQVLRRTGEVLARMSSRTLLMVRWHGDEFAGLARCNTGSTFWAVTQELHQALAFEVLLEGAAAIEVSYAVGAVIASPADDGAALVARADQAMYRAKRKDSP
jgi:diguanylate cyclase (GGDEF)-like protein